jgi:hypothetical protein
MAGNITFIEVQPFTNQSNLVVFCDNIAKQKVNCQ